MLLNDDDDDGGGGSGDDNNNNYYYALCFAMYFSFYLLSLFSPQLTSQVETEVLPLSAQLMISNYVLIVLNL